MSYYVILDYLQLYLIEYTYQNNNNQLNHLVHSFCMCVVSIPGHISATWHDLNIHKNVKLKC